MHDCASEHTRRVQDSQKHRLQCGPLRINFGGSPERASGQALSSSSAQGMRARSGQRRSACFGFAEADDEEGARSAAEQRYLKVCTLLLQLSTWQPWQRANLEAAAAYGNVLWQLMGSIAAATSMACLLA